LPLSVAVRTSVAAADRRAAQAAQPAPITGAVAVVAVPAVQVDRAAQAAPAAVLAVVKAETFSTKTQKGPGASPGPFSLRPSFIPARVGASPAPIL
jgi:hypothetical protein